MKQYIGISRDHSGSMSLLTKGAAKDFNTTIEVIQEAAKTSSLDTIVSVVKCGVGWQGTVEREIVNSNVQILKPMPDKSYIADGRSTPLWDSIGELIDILSSVPDANDPKVSFLVMIITDGEENSSRKWSTSKLSAKIRELHASDRWTFVFRVPKGYSRTLVNFGIPAGNILEWDQTERGIAQSSATTAQAFNSYFTNRAQGKTSTSSFYADLSKVDLKEVKQNLVDISSHIKKYSVGQYDDGIAIKAFIEQHDTFRKGGAFYELKKSETVQDYKEICIVDKLKGSIYTGINARRLLGLPDNGSIKLRPGDMGAYEVYVQSTSVNRKLAAGTSILYLKELV